MPDRAAEETAVTPPTVKPGMGYPNHREETSPTPIGWQGLDTENFSHVSRETSTERAAE
jgi:hypothetical protein